MHLQCAFSWVRIPLNIKFMYSVLIPIPQICVVGIRQCCYLAIYVHHVDHRLKILWGKSQATVPAPGKKGGRELAPVPGLPKGRYDCVGT